MRTLKTSVQAIDPYEFMSDALDHAATECAEAYLALDELIKLEDKHNEEDSRDPRST
jgi:hypothetical protein